MAGEIRVDTRELDKALDSLAGDVARMPETWAAVGDALLPGIRERSPVRSGALRDSWTAEGQADRTAIGSELPYAGVVEAINRPIGDTLDASERLILDTLEDEIAREAARLGFEVKR